MVCDDLKPRTGTQQQVARSPDAGVRAYPRPLHAVRFPHLCAADMSAAHRGRRPGVGGGCDVFEIVGARLHAVVHLKRDVQDQVCARAVGGASNRACHKFCEWSGLRHNMQKFYDAFGGNKLDLLSRQWPLWKHALSTERAAGDRGVA